MAYRISYTEKALKYLERLNKKEMRQLYNKIERIIDNPLHYIEKLVSVNLWKLRIGDYRAIIKLGKLEQEIAIIDIGHRKNIYKKL
ncbi:MAG: type II toxin-antitoxin system RelE/ParE family toxin [Candidatus Woesearchaeota archaeon]